MVGVVIIMELGVEIARLWLRLNRTMESARNIVKVLGTFVHMQRKKKMTTVSTKKSTTVMIGFRVHQICFAPAKNQQVSLVLFLGCKIEM